MKHVTALIALTLVFTVILSGAHAKEVVSLPSDTAHKSVATEDTPVKIVNELHSHTDKAGKSFVKSMGDTLQADNRLLRLRHKKHGLRAVFGCA
ncbi:MAG TPA: hypothetical protein VFT87_04470 [Candidatus Saccharimonadales bacterium]|nr:hypothetical protein [Candidatus Saccharimonadales bacterium]